MVGGSGNEVVDEDLDLNGKAVGDDCGGLGGNFDENQDDNGIDDGGVIDKNNLYGPMQKSSFRL